MQREFDYRKALAKELKERQLRNPGYSLRSFARDLGLSPAALSQVMSGKRHFSKGNAEKVISALSLIEENEIVVHNDYGRGIYLGLKYFDHQNVKGEFIAIEYADSTLYLPVQNIGLIIFLVDRNSLPTFCDGVFSGFFKWVLKYEKS